MKTLGLFLNGINGGRYESVDAELLANVNDLRTFGEHRKLRGHIPDVLVRLARETDAGGTLWKGIRQFQLSDIVDKKIDNQIGTEPASLTMLSAEAIKEYVETLCDGKCTNSVALVLGGHAGGPKIVLDNFPYLQRWSGGSFAESPAARFLLADQTPHWLTCDELTQGLTSAGLGGGAINRRLSVIGFDACHIASFELATELVAFAEFFVASQISTPLAGWNYADWPNNSIDGSANARRDAANMVSSYAKRNANNNSAAISAVDLDKLRRCVDQLRVICDWLLDNSSNLDRLAKARALASVIRSDVGLPKVDMVDFFQLFARFLTDVPAMKSCVEGLVLSLRDAISHTWASPESVKHSALFGISLSFPFGRGDFLTGDWKDFYSIGGTMRTFRGTTRWCDVLTALFARTFGH